MITLDRAFADFATLLERDRDWTGPDMTFPRICRRIGVPWRRFDRFLREELGYGGEEILAACRRAADKKP